jgi:hypothetical protein
VDVLVGTPQLYFERPAEQMTSTCGCLAYGVTYLLLLAYWFLTFNSIEDIFGRNIHSFLLSIAFGAAAFLLATICWLTCWSLACFMARPVCSTVLIAAVWTSVSLSSFPSGG